MALKSCTLWRIIQCYDCQEAFMQMGSWIWSSQEWASQQLSHKIWVSNMMCLILSVCLINFKDLTWNLSFTHSFLPQGQSECTSQLGVVFQIDMTKDCQCRQLTWSLKTQVNQKLETRHEWEQCVWIASIYCAVIWQLFPTQILRLTDSSCCK